MDNFWNNNYIEYQSNSDKNNTLSIKEHLDKIKQYLADIINNLKNADAWKIQLMRAINFIPSKDTSKEC